MRIITIGRSTGFNDVVVNDAKVSRNHMQLVQDDNGSVRVVDLDSSNGVYVNGRRIVGEYMLCANDEIRIGDTVIPWQTYFNGALAQPAFMPTETDGTRGDLRPKRNNTALWIILAVLVVLIGVIIIIFITSKKKNDEKAISDAKERREEIRKSRAESGDTTNITLEDYDDRWDGVIKFNKPTTSGEKSNKKSNTDTTAKTEMTNIDNVFNELMAQCETSQIKEVMKAMGWEYTATSRSTIINKYHTGDAAQKQAIVNALKKVTANKNKDAAQQTNPDPKPIPDPKPNPDNDSKQGTNKAASPKTVMPTDKGANPPAPAANDDTTDKTDKSINPKDLKL